MVTQKVTGHLLGIKKGHFLVPFFFSFGLFWDCRLGLACRLCGAGPRAVAGCLAVGYSEAGCSAVDWRCVGYCRDDLDFLVAPDF